jgi:hypothetical protein
MKRVTEKNNAETEKPTKNCMNDKISQISTNHE